MVNNVRGAVDDSVDRLVITSDIVEILKRKEVFVFDWDGTILDSMGVKSGSFAEAFCSVIFVESESGVLQKVAENYLRLSGHPRKLIFSRILSILGLDEGPDAFERFNSSFEKLNRSSLIHAQIFPDALELLGELIKRGDKIFISSSVPPQELFDLVQATLPAQIKAGIAAIFGSVDGFTKGVDHIQAIVKDTNVALDRVLVLGDDLADHELGTEAGVDCVLVNRAGIVPRSRVRLVQSLAQITKALPT
jgi:phosphoglycolate phosphatase-like HAD superfamily hydrolase